ncbi:MAG: hypothetical protein Q4D05_08440 [Acinetobacter sp.]|nr:hypothetical protein [Acinetobacter sp.]
MRNKTALGCAVITLLIALLGCQQSNHEQQNKATKHETMQQAVFVAHLPKLDEVGDAAALIGTLNEQNNCLYINQHLVVVAGIHIQWQEKPFWIGHHLGEKFSLGDSVHAGGSEIPYSTANDNSPNQRCQAEKIWLLHSISKPF